MLAAVDDVGSEYFLEVFRRQSGNLQFKTATPVRIIADNK